MNINITGHGLEITPALRELTLSKFEKVKRHFEHITSVHIIFETQKLQHTVETTMHVPGLEICAKGSADDMYKALDEMFDKLDRQVRRHKDKLTNHHRGE